MALDTDQETEALNHLMNKGREPVQTTVEVMPFEPMVGPILYTVPLLREKGRAFAAGRVVLKERLDAMVSEDDERINVWCRNYFDLSDACITFEDKVKVQPDSAMLKGIRGVVKTCDGESIAIDAEAVYKSTKGRMGFDFRQNETVHYGEDGRTRLVHDVALFRLMKEYIEIDADQFKAMPGRALKRDQFAHGFQFDITDMIRKGEVVHEIYNHLWPSELFVPLVKHTFRLLREENKRKGMGFYLQKEPKENAELRNFCIERIGIHSRINGYAMIGENDGMVVGVVEGNHMGYSKKH